ncbi:hypothetical protein Esti_000743 [Eimeria stiedai]
MSRGDSSKGIVLAPLGLAVLCITSLFSLFTDASSWTLPHVEAAAGVGPPSVQTGAAPFSPFSGVIGGRDASSQEESSSFSDTIDYEGCGAPLVVGGEVVRCEGGTKTSKSPAGRFGNRAASGPLLNQLFFVEVSADIGRRSVASRQQTSENSTAATAAKKSDASNGAAEDKDDGWNRMKSVSEEPHFLRIFGRWVPFTRGLHMWLDTDVSPTPLRRLSAEAKSEAAHQEPHSLKMPSQGPQGLAGGPIAGIAVSGLPRGRSPYVYWRQSGLPPSVQGLCIALIKQPAGETGSFSPPFKPTTAHIPGSCEEAQKLLSSIEASAEPVWLSCGPQLELSRLTHFLTFMMPQEKLNQVLAGLDYSVDVWREPHHVQSQRNSNNLTSLSQGGEDSSQTHLGDLTAGDIQKKPESSETSLETHQGIPPARDVEARRLAAVQSENEVLKERPKWRVGVCLLKASLATSMDHVSPSQKTGSKALNDPGDSSASTAGAAPSTLREGKAQDMRGALEGLQAVREAQENDLQKLALGSTDAQLVGELRFHVAPELAASHADDEGEKGDPETIQIRHFIDAGWVYSRAVEGVNLTRFNRLALKESTEGVGRPCSGFWEQHSLLGVAPEVYAWDEATQRETLKFKFSNSLQEGLQSREALYNSMPGHHATSKMHVCFYPNDEKPYGVLLGEVQFVIDSADATLLVFFILFVFLAIPVTCAVAISFHIYKHRHLRERLQRLVLVQQRDAVEQLLMRELGLTAEDREEQDDDDDEDEPHNCSV